MLFTLLRDPVRVSFFILRTRESSGLFNQLPEVLTNNGDALFEFSERSRVVVAHDGSPKIIVFSSHWSSEKLTGYSVGLFRHQNTNGHVPKARPPGACPGPENGMAYSSNSHPALTYLFAADQFVTLRPLKPARRKASAIAPPEEVALPVCALA